MRLSHAAVVVALGALAASPAHAAELQPPKAGPVELYPEKDLKPGQMGTAWTVFAGSEPEPVPVEIVGILKNGIGPNVDMILGKMGGRAKETNVAAGMSGSPVYIDGKLVGAVSYRISVFSPDAICGITPIASMLEINALDSSRPTAVAPKGQAASFAPGSQMIPIETPLTFSGVTPATLQATQDAFRGLGFTPVQGGASSAGLSTKPVAGWEKSLAPGTAVSAILASGDVFAGASGTVTYNDGKRILAFGHPFSSLGPVDMPMAKADVVMTLASSYQPTKLLNPTDVVGALKQDRLTGIMGELGSESRTIPVHMKVRSLDAHEVVIGEREFRFRLAVSQQFTAQLILTTALNSLQQVNEFAPEVTYRMSGQIVMKDGKKIDVSTILAPGDSPQVPATALSVWWADKFNRLFANPVAVPEIESAEASIDMLPDRRSSAIESAWAPVTDVDAGTDLPVKVFLRPYRGVRIERDVTVKIPAGLSKGEHRILFSDAATLNRLQNSAFAANRYLDLPETVSLLNQERVNNRMYVSIVDNRATYFAEDKPLPALPASVLNVLQTERTSTRSLPTIAETAEEQFSVPFDQSIGGSYSLRIVVR